MPDAQRTFLIVGAGPRSGKTLVGCALGFALNARAMNVGVMKLVETGCPERAGVLEPVDALSLARAAACDLPTDLIAPYRYRARTACVPAAADEDHAVPPDIEGIAEALARIKARCDAVIVEAPGGLADPINWRSDVSEVAARCGLEVVVVVANRPGCINATLLTLAYAAGRHLRVAGYIVNDAEPSDERDAAATAALLSRLSTARGLGSIRHREPMSLAIVEALLA